MKLVWETPVEAHIRGTYHKVLVASWVLLMLGTAVAFISSGWLVVDSVLNDKHHYAVYAVLLFLVTLGFAQLVSWLPRKLYVSYKVSRLVKHLDSFNNFLSHNKLEKAKLDALSMKQLFSTGKIVRGDWIITISKTAPGLIELWVKTRVGEPTEEVM